MNAPLKNPVFLFLGFVIVVFVGVFVIQRLKAPTPAGPQQLGFSEPRGALVGAPAPAFTLPEVGGASYSLRDAKGKVVILNFWATWCGPCKREIPDFIELQRRYGERGLQILGVALDDRGPVEEYTATNGLNYHVLIGDGQIAQLYGGITSIPTTFIIDRSGKIVNSFVGLQPKDVWLAEIEKLL